MECIEPAASTRREVEYKLIPSIPFRNANEFDLLSDFLPLSAITAAMVELTERGDEGERNGHTLITTGYGLTATQLREISVYRNTSSLYTVHWIRATSAPSSCC